ncbi:MAG: I78 family peptidase inhibitor [Pseudomonadota bacterium]
MRYIRPVVIMLFLGACAGSAPEDREVPDNQSLPGPSEGNTGGGELADIELCDAQTYRDLVGSDVDDASFPTAGGPRVFGVNDIVTQDFIPQRTNVVFDTSRRIVRVYCG